MSETRGLPVHVAPPLLSRTSPALARIVVPFTSVHRDTRAALEPYGPRVKYCDVSEVGAYWRLFSDLWAAGEDFILIEHDIVVRPGTIDGFDRCPSSWCSCSYTWNWKPAYSWLADRSAKVLENSLGCTRFRAEFLKASPDLGTDAVLERFARQSKLGSLVEARRRFTPRLAPPIPHYLVDQLFLAVVADGGTVSFCAHERVGHRQ